MGGYVSGEITNKPRWQISTLNAAQNLFCLGWSRCIVTFLLTKHANCDIILRGSGKNVWKVASMKATLKVFQSGKGCVSSSCFLTTWCGWFHMSNRPQSPSSWGESPRWLVVVMVAWCWRHQGQACVAKVCAQRVQETEYCRQHTHMQQHWILKQCWATAWDRILRQYWMYSSTIRNKCIPLNTASTTILSELYLYLSSGICVFVMMINSAILKTASTRILFACPPVPGYSVPEPCTICTAVSNRVHWVSLYLVHCSRVTGGLGFWKRCITKSRLVHTHTCLLACPETEYLGHCTEWPTWELKGGVASVSVTSVAILHCTQKSVTEQATPLTIFLGTLCACRKYSWRYFWVW